MPSVGAHAVAVPQPHYVLWPTPPATTDVILGQRLGPSRSQDDEPGLGGRPKPRSSDITEQARPYSSTLLMTRRGHPVRKPYLFRLPRGDQR